MKHRFEVLDIFRGIFASMVMFFHLSDFTESAVLKNSFVLNSFIFVDFFFVLSGFVITYSYQQMSKPGEVGLFLKKRFFRLYPLHVIMLLIFVAREYLKHFFAAHIQVNHLEDANNTVLTFFSNLFLLNSVKLPGVKDVSWNIPSWSISAEVISYLLFGLVVLFINRSNIYKNRNYVFAAVALGALFLVPIIAPDHDFRLTYSFDYGFLRGIVGFFTGAVCFNVFSATRARVVERPASFFVVAELVLIAAMIIMVCNGGTTDKLHGFIPNWCRYGFLYEILFFCAIYIFAFEKGIVSSLLKKSGFLKKVGTYSYSIYMVHALLLSMFNILFIRVLKMPESSYSYMFIVNFLLIYFVSGWTYKHIELRFQLKKPAKQKA